MKHLNIQTLNIEIEFHRDCIVLYRNNQNMNTRIKQEFNKFSNELNIPYRVHRRFDKWFVQFQGREIDFSGKRVVLWY